MSRRMERVNQLIRDELSQLIRDHMKESALESLISVTQVETGADLSSAKVFVSMLGTLEQKKEVLDKLSAAAGFFRKELAGRLFIRRVPELFFRTDESIERGSRILELLDKVAAQEEKKPAAKKQG